MKISISSNQSVARLLVACFEARDCAHLEHLSTTSAQIHTALNLFYTSIVDLADKFVETYQGSNGVVLDLPRYVILRQEWLPAKTALAALREVVKAGSPDYPETTKQIVEQILILIDETFYKMSLK